jgi:hypothetical protein
MNKINQIQLDMKLEELSSVGTDAGRCNNNVIQH